jgi:hypothetical protein
VGPEADDWQCFTSQRGQHQFTGFAVFEDVARDRVDDFWTEVVFPDVAAVLGINSFTSQTRTHQF